MIVFAHSPTRPLSVSPIHPLARPLTHSPTLRFASRPLAHSPFRPFTLSLALSPSRPLTASPTHPLAHSSLLVSVFCVSDGQQKLVLFCCSLLSLWVVPSPVAVLLRLGQRQPPQDTARLGHQWDAFPLQTQTR